MQAQMLAPAAALVLWSLIMLMWMAAVRLPPLLKAPGGLGAAKAGARGADLEGALPDSVNWKSHNYTHLMEQPTIFYPIVVILALSGANPADVAIAWGYVGLRVVHSIWQATVNTLTIRFTLFLLATICLLRLAIHAFELTALGMGGAA